MEAAYFGGGRLLIRLHHTDVWLFVARAVTAEKGDHELAREISFVDFGPCSEDVSSTGKVQEPEP